MDGRPNAAVGAPTTIRHQSKADLKRTCRYGRFCPICALARLLSNLCLNAPIRPLPVRQFEALRCLAVSLGLT